ncbi:hypothetical protein BDP27DRAFT_284671 [Rhodocollybia butyracea]|uniref:Uncharacterized protein n=1 Tax=Rhodocollybia butyracea TaxID=206335 RepID=A0A9P5Q3V8_9AGAR|nr:hypothetical protein BDP27DRAFT_284671 [Rhodocollybia butyracea]
MLLDNCWGTVNPAKQPDQVVDVKLSRWTFSTSVIMVCLSCKVIVTIPPIFKLAFRSSVPPHFSISWFPHHIFHLSTFACFLDDFFRLLSVEIQLIPWRPNFLFEQRLPQDHRYLG